MLYLLQLNPGLLFTEEHLKPNIAEELENLDCYNNNTNVP